MVRAKVQSASPGPARKAAVTWLSGCAIIAGSEHGWIGTVGIATAGRAARDAAWVRATDIVRSATAGQAVNTAAGRRGRAAGADTGMPRARAGRDAASAGK